MTAPKRKKARANGEGTIYQRKDGRWEAAGYVLAADGTSKRVRVYGTIRTALTDLTTGGCDAFMKLAPVLTELVKPLPGVEVVQRGISVEDIALAVGLDDQALLARITVAQTELECNGTLPRIRQKWLGNSDADQSSAVH